MPRKFDLEFKLEAIRMASEPGVTNRRQEGQKMNVGEAAILVLQASGEPLHAKEITKRILAKQLWRTTGKTPTATVSARLYSDIKKNGKASPFILISPQTFSLNKAAEKPKALKKSSPTGTSSIAKTKSSTCSFTDSAEKILEKFGNKRPMHYRLIRMGAQRT